MATDCRRILEELSDPDRRRSPEVREHLVSCTECRAAAGVIDRIEGSRLEPEPLRLTGFAARVAARRSSRARHAKVLGGALAAGAIAAATLVGISLPNAPVAPAAQIGAAQAPVELIASGEESERAPEDLEWDDSEDWGEDTLLGGSLDGELARMEQVLDLDDDEASDSEGT
jgi:hypothetical protein